MDKNHTGMMEHPSLVTQKKRAMVQSILSPPNVKLNIVMENQGMDTITKRCSLCEYDSSHSQGLVSSSVLKELMTQSGLNFGEVDALSYCSFCLAQVGNLLVLKRKMDAMGEKLATMILGLHTLLIQSHPFKDNVMDPNVHSSKEADKTTVVVTSNDRNKTSGKKRVPNPKKKPPTKATKPKKKPPTKPKKVTKKYPCYRCKKQFPNLKEHNASVHPVNRPYGCPQCPRCYAQKKTLSIHLLSHEVDPKAQKPFSCPFCPERFAHPSFRKRHALKIHRKRELSKKEFFARQKRMERQGLLPPSYRVVIVDGVEVKVELSNSTDFQEDKVVALNDTIADVVNNTGTVIKQEVIDLTDDEEESSLMMFNSPAAAGLKEEDIKIKIEMEEEDDDCELKHCDVGEFDC